MSLNSALRPLALIFALAAAPAAAQQVMDVADTVETVMPSVAFIMTEGSQGGMGSGFIYDAHNGFIITNNHVIDGANGIHVVIDDIEYPATLVGTEPITDVAVLKITPRANHPLTAATIGNSDAIRVGNPVIAIGAPFGFVGTVTTGIISAKDRPMNNPVFDQYLQTDAAINRGNSGGPLFNVQGEVVGINVAIMSPTGTSAGIGLSIPSSHFTWVADHLIANGSLEWGFMGIAMRETTFTDRLTALVPPGTKGVMVENTAPNGPANGILLPGDIILSVNGEPIDDMRELTHTVSRLLAGTTADIVVQRNYAAVPVRVVLGARPVPQQNAVPPQMNPPLPVPAP